MHKFVGFLTALVPGFVMHGCQDNGAQTDIDLYADF